MLKPTVLALLCIVFAAVESLGAGEKEKVAGYAEWIRDDVLIVDGQRVRVTAATKLRGKNITSLTSIPLGYEVEAEGVRGADGVISASRVEAKPNGSAMFETEVKAATDELEALWLQNGAMFEVDGNGSRREIGKTLESGPQVDRVRGIMRRLLPPYVSADSLRVHVVDTKEWNAAAMGNGAIWVYTGLIDQMTDDELAIVLGHELAHYTHEHSRRNAKKGMWGQLLAVGAVAAAEAIDNRAARAATQVGSLLAFTAWQSGYSRDLEDQADRVGLRYSHEGGFDVRKGPDLWGKFREKYGEQDRVTNFFFGSHSRPSDRIENIERELALNYR